MGIQDKLFNQRFGFRILTISKESLRLKVKKHGKIIKASELTKSDGNL